jgi:hypothetical protein
MTELELQVAFAVALKHGITPAEACTWVADVVAKGTSSEHFDAVWPVASEVLQPLVNAVLAIAKAVIPLLAEAKEVNP